MLSVAVPFLGLELIAWPCVQRSKLGWGMQQDKLTLRHPFNVPEPRLRPAVKQRLGFAACESPYYALA